MSQLSPWSLLWLLTHRANCLNQWGRVGGAWGSFKLETRQDKGYPKFIQLKGFLFFFLLWRALLSHASTELPSSLSWKHRHPRLLKGQGLGCWLHHKTSESPAFSSHSLPVLTTFTRESGGQESPRPQLGNKVKGVKVGHFQRKSMGRVWQGQESICKREKHSSKLEQCLSNK